MNPELKEKLKRWAPWLLGGAAVVVVLLMMRKGGSQQQGRAPVQDLSRLGGGAGSPVMLQPEMVPGEVAEQFAQQFRGGRLAAFRMKGFWDQQQLGQQVAGPVTKTAPTIRREAAPTKIKIPGADYTPGSGGGVGGWLRDNLFGGRPVTLGNFLPIAAQTYGASQGFPTPPIAPRSTSPRANGAQRPNEPTWLEV